MLIKLLLILLLAIHGLIHLLGGLSELKIAEFNNLSGNLLFPVPKTIRSILGIIWLLTTFLFLITAVSLIVHIEWFKPLAISSVLMSQILITLWWHDAKFGSLVNAVIIILIFTLK